MKGTVKFFNPGKGFGFITDESGKEVFVHFTGLTGNMKKEIKEGDKVTFETEDSAKGDVAVNVQYA